jgi:branched-chain amino acid transport system substrate-binding protein
MKLKKLLLGTLAAACLTLPTIGEAVAQDKAFIPLLVYRTGPFAPSGIPLANGFVDYFKTINARGGVNGVQILWEECETQYDTKQGVECYEKMKGLHGGALIINPYSTGITYALIPKTTTDKIVVHSMGYGRTDAGDGRVFPWVFTTPTSYWSQASAFVKYVAAQMGGTEKLKGKKIAVVYHNSPYGKEAIPTMEELAKRYGYELTLLPVDSPGQEQKATWLQVRRLKPDYIFFRGWGVMNQVGVKEAAAIGFPMDRIVGNWWTGSEADVRPAGKDSIGYKSFTFHSPGSDTKLHRDILKELYGGNEAAAKANNFGEVLYNRGIANAFYNVEAIRLAQEQFKVRVPTSEQVRWGYENFKVTPQRMAEIGLEGFMQPPSTSCADHEGFGPLRVQQWDGNQFKLVSDWIQPMKEVVRPMIEESAKGFAQQNNIQLRSCPTS